MFRSLARAALITTCLIATFGGSGCGSAGEIHSYASQEGVYVDVGPLQYQVQLSRQLNPFNIEDQAYLVGAPPFVHNLKPDEVLFGVFMRVSNPTAHVHTAARRFSIVDTQNNIYHPIAINSNINVFSYFPAPVGSGSVFPDPESVAANGSIQGAMLLFVINLVSYENRPLTMYIRNPVDPKVASIDLDV